jgi:hypothetical protein
MFAANCFVIINGMEKFVIYIDRVFPDGTKRTVLAASYEEDGALDAGFQLWDKIMNKHSGSTEAECSIDGKDSEYSEIFMGRITVQSVVEFGN